MGTYINITRYLSRSSMSREIAQFLECLSCKHEDQGLVPRNHFFKWSWLGMIIMLVLVRQSEADTWGSMASQHSLPGKFQVRKRSCLEKTPGEQHQRDT